MGLFNFGKKNPRDEEVQEQKAPGNPTTMILFRVLAIGYVIWMLKDVVKAYFAGGPDAPSGLLVLVAVLVLGGGCVWIGIMSYKQYKQMKEAEREMNKGMKAGEEKGWLTAQQVRASLKERRHAI